MLASSAVESHLMPRYYAIMLDIKSRIGDGTWQPGDQLPSEMDLSLQYSVSRMTCRRALDELAASGLIYRRHGAGTFVARKPLDRDHTRLNSFFDDCRAKGIQPSVKVLSRTLEPASAMIAAAFDTTQEESLVRITTLRYMDGLPTTLHDAHVPLKLCPWLWEMPLDTLQLTEWPLWQLLESHGMRIANVRERLEARMASPHVCELLQLPSGAPILYASRVVYTQEGIPVKYADCYNRGDSFFVNLILTR